MRWLVFPADRYASIRLKIKYGLRINLDLADNVLFRRRVARIYTEGAYEEYEIDNVIELDGDTYFIAGRLIGIAKPDYLEPVKNKEVWS